MIVYGFAKNYTYNSDGTMLIQVRIPSIHGPFRQVSTKNKYTRDADLPWYVSLLTINLPMEGDVVILATTNEGLGSDFIVLGLTGGNYYNGATLDQYNKYGGGVEHL